MVWFADRDIKTHPRTTFTAYSPRAGAHRWKQICRKQICRKQKQICALNEQMPSFSRSKSLLASTGDDPRIHMRRTTLPHRSLDRSTAICQCHCGEHRQLTTRETGEDSGGAVGLCGGRGGPGARAPQSLQSEP
eukprot:3886008-Prymnesium_polylepis.1